MHLAFAVASGTAVLEQTTPQSWREAMASPDSAKWLAAAEAEFNGCVAGDTWELVPRASLPLGANIIRVKWVFKVKTNEFGLIDKYKARITPKGYMQRHGVDFFDVYASTGLYKSLRVFFSVAARKNLELRQLDVPQAFIQAPLDEVVYMEMPEGFAQSGMVCRLKRSLYGLKQSPRNWRILFTTFLIENLGFTSTVSDPNVFTRITRTGEPMMIFLFVDDLQAGFETQDEGEWSEIHAALKERFNITDLGETKHMLGMRIVRDRAARTLSLDQELYITKSLEKFGLHACKPKPTPGIDDQPKTIHDPVESIADELDQPCDLKLFQEKVGTLLYAAISTRFDISFAVHKLTRKMQAPSIRDMRACDRVFRYLAGTKSLGLLYGRECKDVSKRRASTATVTAWADADWGHERVDRKSVSGYLTFLNGDLVNWGSKRQKVVSQSTCEAELYAEAAAINDSKWLSGLVSELGLSQPSAPLIHGDNQSAISLSKNGIKSERTKHIAIKYAFIYDEVSSGRVQLEWVRSAEQLADILTKALPRSTHVRLRDLILARVSPPAQRLVGIELNPGPPRRSRAAKPVYITTDDVVRGAARATAYECGKNYRRMSHYEPGLCLQSKCLCCVPPEDGDYSSHARCACRVDVSRKDGLDWQYCALCTDVRQWNINERSWMSGKVAEAVEAIDGALGGITMMTHMVLELLTGFTRRVSTRGRTVLLPWPWTREQGPSSSSSSSGSNS